MTEGIADVGAQPERTLLAWRRTILASLVGISVAMRLTFAELGGIALAVGTVGLLAAVAAWVTTSVRYRRVHQAMSAGAARLPLDGMPVAAGALAAGLLGVLALALALG